MPNEVDELLIFWVKRPVMTIRTRQAMITHLVKMGVRYSTRSGAGILDNLTVNHFGQVEITLLKGRGPLDIFNGLTASQGWESPSG